MNEDYFEVKLNKPIEQQQQINLKLINETNKDENIEDYFVV